MDLLFSFWRSEFGTEAITDHRFACEIVQNKRTFITRQHRIPKVFEDIAHLSARFAINTVTGKSTIVDWVKIFGCGFSCRVLSPLNNSRHTQKFCVQKALGSTGETFHPTKDYIIKTRPTLSLLENVKELSQKPKDFTHKRGSLEADQGQKPRLNWLGITSMMCI